MCEDHAYNLQQKVPFIGKVGNFSNLGLEHYQDHEAQLWNYLEINTGYGIKIQRTLKQANGAGNTMALGQKVQTHEICFFILFFLHCFYWSVLW